MLISPPPPHTHTLTNSILGVYFYLNHWYLHHRRVEKIKSIHGCWQTIHHPCKRLQTVFRYITDKAWWITRLLILTQRNGHGEDFADATSCRFHLLLLPDPPPPPTSNDLDYLFPTVGRHAQTTTGFVQRSTRRFRAGPTVIISNRIRISVHLRGDMFAVIYEFICTIYVHSGSRYSPGRNRT